MSETVLASGETWTLSAEIIWYWWALSFGVHWHPAHKYVGMQVGPLRVSWIS